MRWAVLVGCVAWLISTTAWAAEPISVTLKWKPPTTMELSKIEPGAIVDHYNIYLCAANILAGGENADDPQVEKPVCVSTMVVIPSFETIVTADYEVPDMSGTLYARISAVTKSGRESRLSKEVKHPYNFERTGPPQDPEFVTLEAAPAASMMIRR